MELTESGAVLLWIEGAFLVYPRNNWDSGGTELTWGILLLDAI